MANKNEQKAKEIFAKNKEVNKVFITSDGFPFITENAANLHKNRTKGLTMSSYTRSLEPKTTKEPTVLSLEKLNKKDLTKVAEARGIRVDESATKANIINVIKIVDANLESE